MDKNLAFELHEEELSNMNDVENFFCCKVPRKLKEKYKNKKS